MFKNLVSHLKISVENSPEKIAIAVPVERDGAFSGEEKITYSELALDVVKYQHGFKNLGLEKGDRVIVLFKPCIQLYSIVISLISLGIIPVFIDAGMPRSKVLMAFKDSKASVIISISSLLKYFWFIPSLWWMKRFAVDGEGIGFNNVSRLKSAGNHDTDFTVVQTVPDDKGLITFTSGSTGRPKGADRVQGSLYNQHKILKAHLPVSESDIDMTCFPVWVLHNLCCGITTILPKADLANPGDMNPALVYEQLKSNSVSRLGAAPAFMKRLVEYMVERSLVLDDITLAFTGGATVPVEVIANMEKAFPLAKVKIVYGSTEAEPISSIVSQEFLKDGLVDKGYLVGSVVDGVEVCISKLPERPVQEKEVFQNEVDVEEVGEILVSGEHVLKAYVDNEVATLENKVKRRDGSVWHRTGDTGFFDDRNRIWLTGRVKDTIATSSSWVQPFPLEKAVDQIVGIDRSALVQKSRYTVLFLETSLDQEKVMGLLAPVFEGSELLPLKFKICAKIPVDARHNSKINRPLLREQMKEHDADYSGVIG